MEQRFTARWRVQMWWRATAARGKRLWSRGLTAKPLSRRYGRRRTSKGIPVKIQTSLPPHHYAVVYQDIVLGTPDKALFTPPEQCTPYEKMGQVVEKIGK